MTESGNLSGDGTAALLEAHSQLPPPDSVQASDYNYTQWRKLNVNIFLRKIFSRSWKFPDLQYLCSGGEVKCEVAGKIWKGEGGSLQLCKLLFVFACDIIFLFSGLNVLIRIEISGTSNSIIHSTEHYFWHKTKVFSHSLWKSFIIAQLHKIL